MNFCWPKWHIWWFPETKHLSPIICNQQGKRTYVAPTRSGKLAKLVYPVYCTILSLWVYVTETVWLELKGKTCSLTELSFFSHLGLVDDISQDLFFLNELVLVQHLLLPQVMIMLLLVLLQFIQGALQRPGQRVREDTLWAQTQRLICALFLVINRTTARYLSSLPENKCLSLNVTIGKHRHFDWISFIWHNYQNTVNILFYKISQNIHLQWHFILCLTHDV